MTRPQTPSSPPAGAAEGGPAFDAPLRVDGFRGTPEEIEQQWYHEVYVGRGDSMRQLTWRAVLMGSVLGGVLSLTNLYLGLKAGWGIGVTITACIASYAIWSVFLRLGLAKTPMTILENNCMQSTAERGRVFHGHDPGLRVRRVLHDQQPGPADRPHPGLDLLPGDPRGHDGDPDEAPDDQRRAAALPDGHCDGRDAPRPVLDRRPRGRNPPGRSPMRASPRRSASSGPTACG